MAWLVFNEWNWIADDEYLSRKWEASDMNNIDVSSPRRIKPTTAFGYTLTETYWASATLNYVTETPLWVVQSYSTADATYVWTTNTTAYAPNSYIHISTWYLNTGSAWHVDTNPDEARHFFIWVSNIYVVKSDWSALVTSVSINNQTTIWNSRAIVYNPVDSTILYARSNKVYSIDTATYTVTNTAVGQKFKLLSWAVIKYLYTYNNNIIAVSVLWNDTYFDTITQSWWTYTVSGYTIIVKGYKCIDAVGTNWLIYWISTDWIHIFSWQSQQVKKLPSAYSFTTESRVSYNKGYLNIIDWLEFWTYGHTSPWFTDSLSKQDIDRSCYGVTENYLMVFQSWVNKWYLDQRQTWVYNLNNTWISMPYMADEFWATKEWTWLRLWYRLPVWTYSNPATQASIVMSVQTDWINAVNSSTWVTIRTIIDNTKTYIEITPTEIASALATAWYTSNYNWIKFKLNLTWGDLVTANWNSYYTKVPELFDFRIIHDEILISF